MRNGRRAGPAPHRAWSAFGGVLLLVALAVAGVRSADSSVSPEPTPAALAHTSVRNSPGWYANVDPESASVAIGRRTSAPLVREPFRGGARSLDDLGRTVCRLLHHEARDSMLALCVTADEFRDILWREFPQSRPATGLTWQDAWGIVGMRLRNGCSGAVNDHGGHYYEFVRFEQADTTMRFKNFRLHRGLTLVARNDEGREERFDWLRSVAERKGAFKIFGVDD
jgi:hypothetical protein